MRTTPRNRATERPEEAGVIREHPDPDAPLGVSESLRGDAWKPAVDVFETEDAVIARFEMAGVRAEDLRVNVDGELLRIRGVRRTPVATGVRHLHQMEIAFGPFECAVRIPIPFDRDAVGARLENGLLEVRLPRRGPVTIEVKTDE